ncbi:hypothetical protein EQY75_00205 [Muriicola soli]|uniref:Uncharacterized protein n=1 Tax=Muriicola soli TaxID=2507538 RepID=A0A411E687_9FLAO|nr:hypothetical protein [Muriicola soli]QBA63122.1 hypothetical protein EQY75_00205 [Muriicola soli]
MTGLDIILQGITKLIPVFFWHHNIRNNKIRDMFKGHALSLKTVFGSYNFVFGGEDFRDEIQQVFIILNQQNNLHTIITYIFAGHCFIQRLHLVYSI